MYISWYDTTVRHECPENSDLEAEQKWAIETGFTRAAYIGYQPFDLPSILKGKKKRPVNGVELPVALDHLRVYRNLKTRERVAIFHEYPVIAEEKHTILKSWCEENGLEIIRLERSWYYPDVCTAFLIREKHDDQ